MAVNDRRMCDDLDDRVRSLDAPGAPVKLERILQEGAFGRVYHGTFKSKNGGVSEEVLVKTVSGKTITKKIFDFILHAKKPTYKKQKITEVKMQNAKKKYLKVVIIVN